MDIKGNQIDEPAYSTKVYKARGKPDVKVQANLAKR
jgi:hypothetical protein